MRQLKLAAVLVALLVLVACPTATKPATTLPPGALNTFDANSYVTLMGAQAALNTGKSRFCGGQGSGFRQTGIERCHRRLQHC